jgi:hypothetical protein
VPESKDGNSVMGIEFLMIVSATLILIDYETGGIRKLIFLIFHAYIDHPNRM